MPTIYYDTYYTIKEDYAKKLIKKYQTYLAISQLSRVPLPTIENLFKVGHKVSIKFAQKICDIEGLILEEGFDVFEPIQVDRDLTNTQLSEQMINGFKANIVKRLSVTHSKMFIDEIIKLVDDIIEESCYLGIECQKLGKTDFIKKKIYKRRRNE